MTKEENIAILNEHLDHWKRLLSEKICDQSEGEKTIDALQNAIKALEKEPCGDCIRRSDVGLTDFEIIMCNGDYREGLKILLEKIAAAPSVSPIQKIGKWEYIKKEDSYKCSLCGFPCHKDNLGAIPTMYCAGCGANMQEVQDE